MATNGPPTKNLSSYYKRPSAAIERGGGFFIPGLQGSRLQLVFSGVILGLLLLGGSPPSTMSPSQLSSEVLATMAGLVLLLQGFLDQQKEEAVQVFYFAIPPFPSPMHLL
ncbi:unnamed protein product [Choristocarpus tenellus]